MDLSAPFKPEVLRPMVTLVVPGTIAVGPFVLILGEYVEAVATFWQQHPKAFTAILVLVVLAAGYILDDIGTFFEKYIIDKRLRGSGSDHAAQWKSYLKLRLQDEIIGQRYLRNKYTQLKFELSLAHSLVAFWIGLAWLQCLQPIWSSTGFVLASLFILGSSVLSFVAAIFTAKLLGETRALILEAAHGYTENGGKNGV
jgi:hypothetical protein